MSDSPVIHADIGDGKRRRFFLGWDELAQIKRECGRGWYSLFIGFEREAEPVEVAAVLRLALIGGGETPKEAHEIASYYAAPPRPLRDAYMLAYRCLNAVWAGAEPQKGGDKMTADDLDKFFANTEAAMVRGGKDTSVLRGKSLADVQAMFTAMAKGDDASSAPDGDVLHAIKAYEAAK